jgi:Domain of unknown function (DUF1707)
MAAAKGRGHIRASDADREQVIDALKEAFVRGRLTKDELTTRARDHPDRPAPGVRALTGWAGQG